MTIVYVILGVLAYLIVGYGLAMLFIHKLTNGRWATESVARPGTYHYEDMGAGTGIVITLIWPFFYTALAIVVSGYSVVKLLKTDFWKRLYRVN